MRGADTSDIGAVIKKDAEMNTNDVGAGAVITKPKDADISDTITSRMTIVFGMRSLALALKELGIQEEIPNI